jgi:hypothetical protein
LIEGGKQTVVPAIRVIPESRRQMGTVGETRSNGMLQT